MMVSLICISLQFYFRQTHTLVITLCKTIKNWQISPTVKIVDRKMIRLLHQDFVNFCCLRLLTLYIFFTKLLNKLLFSCKTLQLCVFPVATGVHPHQKNNQLHTLSGWSIQLLLNYFSLVAKLQLCTLFNTSSIMNTDFVHLSEPSWQ